MNGNAVIALFLALGLILHWNPIRYVRTFTGSAYAIGPIALQYPLYGGIQGLMTFAAGGVTLAALIADWFLSFSNEYTFAFWTFVSSSIISLFIPSDGGHWVVQGPVMVPAAESLGVDQGLTAMAVAWGEGTANMIQPFWALPILGIVGLGSRDTFLCSRSRPRCSAGAHRRRWRSFCLHRSVNAPNATGVCTLVLASELSRTKMVPWS